MNGLTVIRGGVKFTVFNRCEPVPPPSVLPLTASLPKWIAAVREGWARGRQDFLALNASAPVGATIEVGRLNSHLAVFSRVKDSESPLWDWKICSKGDTTSLGEVTLTEYARYWRPKGTRVWYPFSPGEPAVREEDMPGYDPDFDV